MALTSAKTFEVARDLLASDGELSIIDPCVDLAGAEYYAFKHFPQGRYYISDINKYQNMLSVKFGLRMVYFRQIFGRPAAPLSKVRFIGNLAGFAELLKNNLIKQKPYVANYILKKVA